MFWNALLTVAGLYGTKTWPIPAAVGLLWLTLNFNDFDPMALAVNLVALTSWWGLGLFLRLVWKKRATATP